MFKQYQKRSALSQKGVSLLRDFAALSVQEVMARLEVSANGHTHEEAHARLDAQGKNVLQTKNKDTVTHRLLAAFINPFNLVLLLVIFFTFFSDVIIARTHDYTTVIILSLLIIGSSIIAFTQSERASHAAKKLSNIIQNKSTVLRSGIPQEISNELLVIGDIIQLSAGDMLPADVRFLSTKDTFLSQASLSGESLPVEKFADMPYADTTTLTDIVQIGFAGSNIVSGSATAVIVLAGNQTYLGSMAVALSEKSAKNSFQKGIEAISTLLFRMMLCTVPVIFLLNILTKGDIQSALLFAITMSVGLTPEMLPMILTSTLAKGALAMSRKKTIVKNLSSIQTFGEIDVLCSDKTGTLTEDKVILERYMDVHGTDDLRILRHAYLNSFFQTGLKNLMDNAIIQRGKAQALEILETTFTRVDEIPFDFSRRRMSVVLRHNTTQKRQLITKGAVEEILTICAYMESNGEIVLLNDEQRQKALALCEAYNAQGHRMLAVAQKNNIVQTQSFSIQDEENMVLIGFIGFLDPPKASCHASLQALRQHGVRVIVLTGDSGGVTRQVCEQVGVKTEVLYTGSDVTAMDDATLLQAVEVCDVFVKLSPMQKKRIVEALQKEGHSVGFLGDGINDALALKQADIGISVDSAVDIAKESADMILLEKDLMVLEEGIMEGRKTFANISKYMKMAISGNFGNMISVMIASIFLPFLPLLPVHILIQNLLSDFAQIGIPFDSVDAEAIRLPRRFDVRSIMRFMGTAGLLSSLFDIGCFIILYFVIGANTPQMASTFHAGLFVYGTLSQALIVHMIRTSKKPLVESSASLPLILSTCLVAAAACLIAFTPIAQAFDMAMMPLHYIPYLFLLLSGYACAIQFIKVRYIRRFHEWL